MVTAPISSRKKPPWTLWLQKSLLCKFRQSKLFKIIFNFLPSFDINKFTSFLFTVKFSRAQKLKFWKFWLEFFYKTLNNLAFWKIRLLMPFQTVYRWLLQFLHRLLKIYYDTSHTKFVCLTTSPEYVSTFQCTIRAEMEHSLGKLSSFLLIITFKVPQHNIVCLPSDDFSFCWDKSERAFLIATYWDTSWLFIPNCHS